MFSRLKKLGDEIKRLQDENSNLLQRLGYLEEHHGDALTEFGRRIADIENNHGNALTKLGSRLEMIIKTTERTDIQSFKGTSERLIIPENTFISEIPVRYSEQLSLYRAQGGSFDPAQNSIRESSGDMVRFYTFSMIFDLLEGSKIAGDVAELGVFKGDTAVMLANFARRSSRHLYLLDTFEGFPESDLEEGEKHLAGAFSDTNLDYVKSRVGEDKVTFIQGFFPDTAALLPRQNSYSLVHIDADLYAPIKAGLEYFYPRLIEGGFLIMHDYMSLYWDGAIRAIDEFFADKPEFIVPIPDRSGTVVIRKCRL